MPGGPGGDDLAFVGRMSPSKGLPAAIRVARRCGRRLHVMSKMWHPEEVAFFEAEVRPLLDDDVVLHTAAGPAELVEVLRHAAALLNPIRWAEPFGLVMAEALACGTPVVTFPEGAAPEIVDHGLTGFLCRDEDDMVDAVGLLDAVDRAACRAAAEVRFSAQRMATDHVALYERVLETSVEGRAPALSVRP